MNADATMLQEAGCPRAAQCSIGGVLVPRERALPASSESSAQLGAAVWRTSRLPLRREAACTPDKKPAAACGLSMRGGRARAPLWPGHEPFAVRRGGLEHWLLAALHVVQGGCATWPHGGKVVAVETTHAYYLYKARPRTVSLRYGESHRLRGEGARFPHKLETLDCVSRRSAQS